ncbi:hypothetical protein C8N24_2097 [Solirubrobacter pauli]|uniref:Uncharacterized protein n=1 Tax=Solirubrobacter pauli TaxID=166793 RepID=A0A660LH14_9ACTN|nr:hypothetical protein [Solirubrobacter pauli]RKQ92254.1 hypothetical protein C8N24_2097 [Solirubrobacter pauli]
MKRLILALTVLALSPAPALAQQSDSRIASQYSNDGDPIIRIATANGDKVEAFRRCAPGGAPCEPIAFSPSGFGEYSAGVTAPGTVFEADVRSSAGVLTTIRSVPWQGPPTAVTLPTLVGEARVGGTVTAVDGTWSGGWGDRPGWRGEVLSERTYSWVIACRTPERTGCWSFNPAGPLTQRWAGWYLFAASSRSDGDNLGKPVAVIAFWPFPTIADMRGSATRAYGSTPLRVCCTLPAPAADPDPPAPTATLRTRAIRSGGRLLVGRVDCTLECTVGLAVFGGGRALKRTFSTEGPKALTIPRRRGRLLVRVRVDGKLLATRRMSAR